MMYVTAGNEPGHGDGPGDMMYVTAGNEPGHGAGTEYDAVTHGDQPNGQPDDNLPTYQVSNGGGERDRIFTSVYISCSCMIAE